MLLFPFWDRLTAMWIFLWILLLEAFASITVRHLLWGKTQSSCCISLVPRFFQRECEVTQPLGVRFLHITDTTHESFCFPAHERHIHLWIWTQDFAAVHKSFLILGTCTWAFMHAYKRLQLPWHWRSCKPSTSASKSWTQVPFNCQWKPH